MRRFLKYTLLFGTLLNATVSLNAQFTPYYQYAVVRELADSFEDSLKLNTPMTPIDLQLAKQQHHNYITLLETLIPHVIKLDADPLHPDCNFVEDTALIVDDIAVVSRMGAIERRGEEEAVREQLQKLGVCTIVSLESPCTMDGGDILFTGKHLFVGLSKRTNDHTLNKLKEIFRNKVEVIGIPVTEGLHLKSVMSLFDTDTLIVASTTAGNKILNHIESSTNGGYTFVLVPDSAASNVLRIGSSLIVQSGFPASEAILQKLCERNFVTMLPINMSEIIKADGALTCGSILFN